MPGTFKTCLWVLSLTIGAACGAIASADEPFGPSPAPASAKTYKLGGLEVTSLHDAQYVVPNDGKVFGVDAGATQVGELLKVNKLPTDRVTLSVNSLLVRLGGHVVVIDTGLNPKFGSALIASLAEAGVSPEEVTDVLITHSHGDHVGGLVLANGRRAFPKSVVRMSAAEWVWMKTQPGSADVVKVIDGHVQTFAPGDEVVPGVKALALAGHTPGHVGFEIASGGQSLLDIGDLAHSSVISLEKPEWTAHFDEDSDTAKATRRTTLARLAKTRELVFAPHFPYPGVGYIIADGAAYKWMPKPP